MNQGFPRLLWTTACLSRQSVVVVSATLAIRPQRRHSQLLIKGIIRCHDVLAPLHLWRQTSHK